MHRSLQISVDPSATEALTRDLARLDEVIGLSVHRGASIKPPGDVIEVHALNRGGDDVMRLVSRAQEHGPISLATGEVSSLIHPEHQERVNDDIDQALWEETETTIRHQAQLTVNFIALMALGGAVGATGYALAPVPQAIAFVAASVIAPGFEPIAKLPLGAVLRRPDLLRRGLRSMLAGYLALVAGAALAYALLRLTDGADPGDLIKLKEVQSFSHPGPADFVKSSAAAVAGVIMLAAHRSSVLAGPLIALALIPAASLIGVGIAAGRPRLAQEGLERLGIDVVIIIALGALVFGLKQLLRHRRQPLI